MQFLSSNASPGRPWQAISNHLQQSPKRNPKQWTHEKGATWAGKRWKYPSATIWTYARLVRFYFVFIRFLEWDPRARGVDNLASAYHMTSRCDTMTCVRGLVPKEFWTFLAFRGRICTSKRLAYWPCLTTINNSNQPTLSWHRISGSRWGTQRKQLDQRNWAAYKFGNADTKAVQ